MTQRRGSRHEKGPQVKPRVCVSEHLLSVLVSRPFPAVAGDIVGHFGLDPKLAAQARRELDNLHQRGLVTTKTRDVDGVPTEFVVLTAPGRSQIAHSA